MTPTPTATLVRSDESTTSVPSFVTRADLRLAPVALDLYRDIHKGIRSELFALTTEIGRLDATDDAACEAVSTRVRDVAALLDSHAHHEDVIIQPAIEEILPRLAEQIEQEHARFDRRVLALVGLVDELTGAIAADRRHVAHELYLGSAAFTGSYLQHIDLEERTVMPALEQAVGLDAVVAMHGAIVGSIPPDEMARSLALMLPAMNIDDRAEMLAGMREGAPPEVFAGVVDLASTVLDPADHAALLARLGQGRA